MSAPPPAPRRPIVSTYRVQLRAADPAADHPGFTFDDAAGIAGYLADLGVTHLYCSPHLQSTPGSAHGYDVVDPSRLDDELGGAAGFARLVRACHASGLGIIVDVVPNHTAISEPESQNAAWWSVLRDGRSSPYAAWFDIDWDSADNPGRVLVPILAGSLGASLPELELLEDRIRYYDHELPLAPYTRVDGNVLATLNGQHYRLCSWRVASEELDYRRFFDVTTLAGVRVEVPQVFDATHRLVLAQLASGQVDGLRIDHPDGLADPAGYLERLAAATGGAWTVVEKILEPGEQLPGHWRTAGTTGYDALNDILGVLVDPAGEAPLTATWTAQTGDDATFAEVVARSKRLVLDRVLAAEVNRLVEVGLAACRTDPGLRDTTRRGLREAVVEVLVAFGVYRAYLPPTGPAEQTAREHVDAAVAGALRARPERAAEIDVVRRLVLAEGPTGPAAAEFVTRFQQTCGPVMAKGVEDTACYRYLRLSALNEVGGDPGRFGLASGQFHDANAARARDWPRSMTTLSTHDTKRSEDVRARLVLLAQCPAQWSAAVAGWAEQAGPHRSAAGPDGATEQLVWQSLVGAWPISTERAVGYVEKATREAKDRTAWIDPDTDFDDAVRAFVEGVLADAAITASLAAFVEGLERAWRDTVLAQKALQLTVPGVADTYQGTELFDLSLVDPDNRRPVDFGRRRALLAGSPVDVADDAGAAKLALTARLLRLRRERPAVFLDGGYEPLDAGDRAVAFQRGDQVLTIAPTRALRTRREGWGEDAVTLPGGSWRDVVTGVHRSGRVALRALLADFPVAVLVRVQA